MKIELRNPHELRQHKLNRHLPAPDLTSPEWFSFLDTLQAGGAENLPAITITETGFVIDGWRRVLAARNWKWSQVHCTVRSEEDAALIIIESLFGQRDMSRGAKVYFSIPLYPDYAEAAEKRRLANLRKGVKTNEKPLISQNPSDLDLGRDLASICERFGVSDETWLQAQALYRLLHNPKSAEITELLKKADRKLKPSEIEQLQGSLREEFEPQLASGEKGIWFVRSAIGGRLVTEERERPLGDTKQMEFWTSHLHPLRSGIQSWSRLSDEIRTRVKLELRGMLSALPAEDMREILDEVMDQVS